MIESLSHTRVNSYDSNPTTATLFGSKRIGATCAAPRLAIGFQKKGAVNMLRFMNHQIIM